MVRHETSWRKPNKWRGVTIYPYNIQPPYRTLPQPPSNTFTHTIPTALQQHKCSFLAFSTPTWRRNGQTDGRTNAMDQRTDKASYWVACPQLKTLTLTAFSDARMQSKADLVVFSHLLLPLSLILGSRGKGFFFSLINIRSRDDIWNDLLSEANSEFLAEKRTSRDYLIWSCDPLQSVSYQLKSINIISLYLRFYTNN